MALVAYENSDSSDYEENDTETVPITLNKKQENDAFNDLSVNKEPRERVELKDSLPIQNVNEEQEPPPNLFNHLPQPTHKRATVVEEDDEFLHKKETTSDMKPKSKITVPSLSDFKDVKDTVPSSRPKISNDKKSGLLSILPQPKHSSLSSVTSKTLIPQIVTKKQQSSMAKRKDPYVSTDKKSKLESKVNSSNLMSQYSDDSDNDDVQNDFFSINKPVEVLPEELPLDIEQLPCSSKVRDSPMSNLKPRSIESYFKQDNLDCQVEKVPTNAENSNTMYSAQGSGCPCNDTVPSDSGEIKLDEEAILKLCGSRGKRKMEDIMIVDVNQQEVLANAREWLLKGLMDETSKRVSASKKRGNEPTSQQKRKHQITYLAHQAKANEVDLQNQWANNRMTKRQTQSKYGF